MAASVVISEAYLGTGSRALAPEALTSSGHLRADGLRQILRGARSLRQIPNGLITEYRRAA